MRALAICTALLFSSCGPYVSVVGPSRASISGADIDSIKQLSKKFLAEHGTDGSSNTLTLNAVKPDEVWVYTVSQGGTFYIDFAAIRRSGYGHSIGQPGLQSHLLTMEHFHAHDSSKPNDAAAGRFDVPRTMTSTLPLQIELVLASGG